MALPAARAWSLRADAAAAEAAVRAAMVDARVRRRRRAGRARGVPGRRRGVLLRHRRWRARSSPAARRRITSGCSTATAAPTPAAWARSRRACWSTDALAARIEREIVRPVLAAMAAAGTPFRGFLYCGLMLTADGPKVIEFNCRFGDPEAQVVLPLLDEPLSALLLGGQHRRRRCPRAPVLRATSPPASSWRRRAIPATSAAATPSAASIASPPSARPPACASPAWPSGTAALVTAGGRVLTVVGQGADLPRGHRRRLRRGRAHLVRRHAVPHRHRPAGPRRPRLSESMRYAVVTFGCRVNQADSLAVEAGLTGAGAVAVPPERADVVARQHLLGDGERRPGRAPDHPADPPRESGARASSSTGCYASRCGAEVAALPGRGRGRRQRRQAAAAAAAARRRRGRGGRRRRTARAAGCPGPG